jgi:hypothetical protein
MYWPRIPHGIHWTAAMLLVAAAAIAGGVWALTWGEVRLAMAMSVIAAGSLVLIRFRSFLDRGR